MLVLADEKVFHTVQGEGKYVGYPCSFVRMSRCNLRCAWKNSDGSITHCDTPHTSFDPEVNEFKVKEIIMQLKDEGFNHVVVSGGEPYFQSSVIELVNGLVSNGHFVTVETNGTLYRPTNAQFISISPKLACSSAHPVYGDKHERMRIQYDALEKFITNHDYQFKFVVNNESDVAEILDIKRVLFERTGIDINDNIWLMPQGTTVEQFDSKMVMLVELCKTYQWKLTDRLHIRIWGSIKGV